jgi:hypothetical protein
MLYRKGPSNRDDILQIAVIEDTMNFALNSWFIKGMDDTLEAHNLSFKSNPLLSQIGLLEVIENQLA